MIRIPIVIFIALVSHALWLGEICLVKGWAGLQWLHGFNWSSVPISVLVAFACVFVLPKFQRNSRSALFVGLMSALTLVSFVVSRYALMSLVGRMYFTSGEVSSNSVTTITLLVLSWLTLSFGAVLLANRLLAHFAGWTALGIALAIFLALPLAVGSITIIPAINGSTDAIHAVKMGYPVFWAVLLLPLALRAGMRQLHS